MSKPVYGSATAATSLSRRFVPQAVFGALRSLRDVVVATGDGGVLGGFFGSHPRVWVGIRGSWARSVLLRVKGGAPNKVLGESSSGGDARYCLSAPQRDPSSTTRSSRGGEPTQKEGTS